MRSSIFAAITAFCPIALAQSLLTQIPQCAQSCFGNNLGSCGAADIACICGNTPVIEKVTCCTYASCSASDTQATIQFAVQLCKLSNIDVDSAAVCSYGFPTVASSTTSSSARSSTVAGSSTISDSARSSVLATSSTPFSSARSSDPITPSASASATPQPTTSDLPASGGSDGGLSGGAIGGIVGGIVGGLALIVNIAFCLWRRKKSSTVAEANPSSPIPDGPEVSTMEKNTPTASGVMEISGHGQAWEMPGHNQAWPMPGHEQVWQVPRHEQVWQRPGHEQVWQMPGNEQLWQMPGHQQVWEISAEAPRQHR